MHPLTLTLFPLGEREFTFVSNTDVTPLVVRHQRESGLCCSSSSDRPLGLVIPTFIGITLLTFAFVHMIPGDPVMIMAGERGISPERHAQLLAELGLDKPMWQQYLHYIWGVLHG